MTQSAAELNNSEWRKDWTLVGDVLTHVSGLIFKIFGDENKVDVVADEVALMEYQHKEFAKGKTPDDVMAQIRLISRQIQPFYYEAKTGRETIFVPLH